MLSQRSRIETAVQIALQGGTVLTCNTRAARRLHLECALRRHSETGAWRTPDILPFSAWVDRTWTECLLSGLVKRSLLRSGQVRALWEKTIAGSSYGRNLLDARGAASAAMAAFGLVHEYRLPLTRAAYSPTEETRAFFDWTKRFTDTCDQKSWIDASMAATQIAELAARLPARPGNLAVFGFDRFTPSQLQLWNALGQAGTEIALLAPELDGEQGAAQTLAIEDGKTELRAAAAWARGRLEKNPDQRIGIVSAVLESVRADAEQILEEVLHPERMVLPSSGGPRLFDISLGVALDDYPVIRSAVSVLRLAISGVDPDELSSLLRSAYLGGSVSEDCARARVDLDLRKSVKAETPLAQLAEKVEATEIAVPLLRSSLRAIQREAQRLAPSLNRSEWTYHAHRILNAAGWPGDGPDGRKRDSVEFQATEAWQKLLRDFAALDVVEPADTPAALLREFARLAAERTFAPENEFAPVQVVGPTEAAGDCFDALWICGLSDESWPTRIQANPCIPIGLQRDAGIPGASTQASVQQACLTTNRLLQSASECVMSWPEREEDRQLRPSSLVAGFRQTSLADLAICIPRQWAEFAPAPALEEFVDELAPPADAERPEVRTHGTKLLEWQSNCPFQSFAHNRLWAEPVQPLPMGLDPRERGKLVEAVLQRVWEDLRSSSQLTQPTLTEQEIERVIEQAVDFAMDREYPKPEEEWEERYRTLERERLVRLTGEWLELEKKREPFEVVGHQEPVEIDLGGIAVRGQIDRIDRTLEGDYVVIDYKTGRGPYSALQWKVPRPSRPQLPFYAVTQVEQGRQIAGVAYAHLRTGQCAFKGDARGKGVLGNYKNSGNDAFQSRVAEWKPELQKLAAEFLAGQAEVNPKEPPGAANSPCWNCRLGELCRVAELELQDTEAEVDDDE